jgi:hypothetical protein
MERSELKAKLETSGAYYMVRTAERFRTTNRLSIVSIRYEATHNYIAITNCRNLLLNHYIFCVTETTQTRSIIN